MALSRSSVESSAIAMSIHPIATDIGLRRSWLTVAEYSSSRSF
ncbi:MAG: hypothetical protein ACI80F_002831, partial [Natronomonas sp.]